MATRSVTFQQARAPRGSFGFSGAYTGSALADFMLGYLRTASINPTHTNTDLHDVTQAYFVQDDWKTTSRLTFNLGLRYDYFAPYTQSDDRFADVYQNGFLLANVVTPQNSPYGRGLLQPNRKDFGPRFGFAYAPAHRQARWVIRGGYGIYWTTEISNAIFAMAEGAQATSGATVTGPTSGSAEYLFQRPICERRGCPRWISPVRRQQRSKSERQLHPAMEREHPAQAACRYGARCWIRRIEGNALDRDLWRSESSYSGRRSGNAGLGIPERPPSRSAFPACCNRRQVCRQFHLSRACRQSSSGAWRAA